MSWQRKVFWTAPLALPLAAIMIGKTPIDDIAASTRDIATKLGPKARVRARASASARDATLLLFWTQNDAECTQQNDEQQQEGEPNDEAQGQRLCLGGRRARHGWWRRLRNWRRLPCYWRRPRDHWHCRRHWHTGAIARLYERARVLKLTRRALRSARLCNGVIGTARTSARGRHNAVALLQHTAKLGQHTRAPIMHGLSMHCQELATAPIQRVTGPGATVRPHASSIGQHCQAQA